MQSENETPVPQMPTDEDLEKASKDARDASKDWADEIDRVDRLGEEEGEKTDDDEK